MAPSATGACSAARRPGDDPLVVHRGATRFVILNLFPYNNGHLMVVPRRHIASLGDATADELAELIALVRRTERVRSTQAYAPHGINIGLNLGRPPAPASPITCTSTSCRAGTATPTS